MSAYIRTAQPTPAQAAGFKGILQRHPIASYFVLMFAGLWLGYLPLLLSSQGWGVFAFKFPFPVELFNIPASLLGPLVAGVVMSRATGGSQGLREFWRRLFRVRFGFQWYVLALVGPPVLGLLGVLVMQGVAPATAFFGQVGAFVVPYLSGALILALIVNLWEESGQIGFALPALQRKHGAVIASLIIAPMWALMHLPALFVPAMGVGVSGPLSLQGIAFSLGVLIVYAIPVRLLATWLFNNAGQSVVVVALFHAAMNSAQGQFQALIPGFSPFYLLGAFMVVAFILIAVTRGKLGYNGAGEQNAVQPAPSQAAPLHA